MNKGRDKLPTKKYNFDVGHALALRLNNFLSYDQISKQLDIPKATLHKGLKPFLDALSDPEAIKAYEQHEPHLISAAKLKIFTQMLDTDVLKSASLNNLAYAHSQLNTVKRLEEDKSTANVAYADMTRQMKDIDEELAKHGITVTNGTPQHVVVGGD